MPFPHDERASRCPNPTLDWADLLAIERLGVRVESHGITHVPLTSLGDDAAERELVESKRVLEERLGRPIRAYAYVKGGAPTSHRNIGRCCGGQATTQPSRP